MFAWPVRVYYEDTDSGGVVYYANYLKFLERARTEWLRSLGAEQDELMARDGVLFAVHALTMDYLRPARFNDLLWVTAAIAEQGRASLTFKQCVVRASALGENKRRNVPAGRLDQADYDVLIGDKTAMLCHGQVRIACLDSNTLRPRAIPTHLYAEISRGG